MTVRFTGLAFGLFYSGHLISPIFFVRTSSILKSEDKTVECFLKGK